MMITTMVTTIMITVMTITTMMIEMTTMVITNDGHNDSGHNDDEGNDDDGGGCNDSYHSDGCDSSRNKGIRRTVGDAGYELAWAGNDGVLALEGDGVGLVTVWDRDKGDGVCCRA